MRMLVPGILLLLLATILSAQRQADAPDDIKAVLLIEGARSVQMRERIASRKGRSGVANSRQYFILEAPTASARTRTGTPVFQFGAGLGFDDPVYLFRVDIRSD